MREIACDATELNSLDEIIWSDSILFATCVNLDGIITFNLILSLLNQLTTPNWSWQCLSVHAGLCTNLSTCTTVTSLSVVIIMQTVGCIINPVNSMIHYREQDIQCQLLWICSKLDRCMWLGEGWTGIIFVAALKVM